MTVSYPIVHYLNASLLYYKSVVFGDIRINGYSGIYSIATALWKSRHVVNKKIQGCGFKWFLWSCEVSINLWLSEIPAMLLCYYVISRNNSTTMNWLLTMSWFMGISYSNNFMNIYDKELINQNRLVKNIEPAIGALHHIHDFLLNDIIFEKTLPID